MKTYTDEEFMELIGYYKTPWYREIYNVVRWEIGRVHDFFIDTYQKLTQGYPNSDTWSLHCSLAKWMLPRLKAFKDYDLKWSIPMWTLDDYNFNKDITDEMQKEATEKWTIILDDMIYF